MKNLYLLLIITLLLLVGCKDPQFSDIQKVDAYAHEIKLPPPFSSQFAEYSTMCSFGDNLMIIPQYPHLLGEDGIPGRALVISKNLISKYVADKSEIPINVDVYDFMGIKILEEIEFYEGFEAVATDGKNFYFAIETGGEQPSTYAIKATLVDGAKKLEFEKDSLTKLETPITLNNASYESLVLYKNRLFFGYEGNGANINPNPYMLSTDLNFKNHKKVNMQNLEYRLTDFTSVNSKGEIYAINYHWVGDTKKYKPIDDQITGTDYSQIGLERFIPMKFKSGRLVPDPKRPYLSIPYKGRNWEGVEYLDDGIIAVTDKHPNSILMYFYEESDM